MIKKGDTIGIIALSGECSKESAELAKENFEKLGYNVRLSKNIYDKKRYLAGEDEEKISELHKFFIDKDIKMILCARGGYGAIRLINQIDYNLVKSNPKPFCGFSDVTALLLMIYKKAELITYHGPMACTDFGINIVDQTTKQSFFDVINGKNMQLEGKKIYREGKVQGIIWGGNLSTIVSLCGQDFLPDKDFIFFAEDLNEPVYKIDRMFQQLINIPQFIKHCKGIVLGEFLDTDNNVWLEEYFIELASKLRIPLVGGFMITHSREKITLPIGKTGHLEGKTLFIS